MSHKISNNEDWFDFATFYKHFISHDFFFQERKQQIFEVMGKFLSYKNAHPT